MTIWRVVFTLVLLVSTVSSMAARADQGSGLGYGHHAWDGGMHGWYMAPLFMLFLVALVVGAILVVRWAAAPGHHSPKQGRSALDILDERFARGEIDKQEFEERRNGLER